MSGGFSGGASWTAAAQLYEAAKASASAFDVWSPFICFPRPNTQVQKCAAVHIGPVAVVGRLTCQGTEAPGGIDDPTQVLRSLERFARTWAESGSSALERLTGAFAVAVWDERVTSLYLIRDHIGQRPLYYHASPDGWIVASDSLKVVAAHPGVDQTVDEEAVVAQCLGYSPLLRARTPYASIRRLPAGHILAWQAGRIESRRYWSPAVDHRQRDARECAHELRELVTASVADAVGACDRVGAHVSGGLDSSAVAVLAQHELARRGATLVGGFSWSPPPAWPEQATDERPRTEALLSGYDVPLHWTQLDAQGLRRSMASGLEASEAAGLVHEDWVAAAAERTGIDVLLSGWGGDEFASYSGRGALTGAIRRGQLPTAATATLRKSRRPGVPVVRALARTARSMWREGVRPILPLPAPRPAPGSASDVHDSTLSRLHPSAPWMLRERVPPLRAGAAATQLALLEHGHLELRLEAWAHLADKHGYEYRYPLLDPRIVEFALTIPDSVYLAAPVGRWLFREAMSTYLPHDLCWGDAKDEPAKLHSQLDLLAQVPAVRPDGPAEAADIVEHFFELRRELHERLQQVV